MNINSFEIYPYVRVYNNLMDDNQNLYNILQNLTSNFNKNVSFVKTDWLTQNKNKKFGDYLFARENPDNVYEPLVFESLIKNFVNTNYLQEFELFKRIQEIKKLTIEDYVKFYNVNLPKKSFISSGVNIARYDPDFFLYNFDDFDQDAGVYITNTYLPYKTSLSMGYHTDYTGSNDVDRKDQFLITSNIYFNDDYQGGSIIFYVEGDKFLYKPKAGEIVVFPSGSPLFFPNNKKYLHAVETNTIKEKFLSRNYLMYNL